MPTRYIRVKPGNTRDCFKPLAKQSKRPPITPEETAARLRALGVPDENIRRHLRGLEIATAPKPPRTSPLKGRKLSEATKAKMSAVRKGKPHSLNHRLNIIEGLKRRFPNGRYPIEAITANTGAKRSDEARARMRQAALGKRLSADTKAKLATISKARWADEEYRTKLAEARTPECRQAMGKRWRGRTMSDATKALISAGLRRAYAEGRRSTKERTHTIAGLKLT